MNRRREERINNEIRSVEGVYGDDMPIRKLSYKYIYGSEEEKELLVKAANEMLVLMGKVKNENIGK